MFPLEDTFNLNLEDVALWSCTGARGEQMSDGFPFVREECLYCESRRPKSQTKGAIEVFSFLEVVLIEKICGDWEITFSTKVDKKHPTH